MFQVLQPIESISYMKHHCVTKVFQVFQNQHFCNRCNQTKNETVTRKLLILLVVTVVTVVTVFFSTFLFVTENQNGYTEMAGENSVIGVSKRQI